MAPECLSDCGGAPLTLIEAGEERIFSIDALELVAHAMPNACFAGGDVVSVTCSNRVVLPPATYDVTLSGYTDYVCYSDVLPCECEPDATGICQRAVDSAGESLIVTTSFTRPPPEFMIDTSRTTVVLTFEP